MGGDWRQCITDRAGKNLGFKKKFLGFKVVMYAQSHAVHWTQEYDQEEGLLYRLHKD